VADRRCLELVLAIALVGLVLPAGAVASEEPYVEERYVGGASTSNSMPVPEHQTFTVCTDEAKVGGICEEPVPTQTNLVVLVDDDVLDRVPFHWQATDGDGNEDGCPGGHTIGEDTLNLPAECTHIDAAEGCQAFADVDPVPGGEIPLSEGDLVKEGSGLWFHCEAGVIDAENAITIDFGS
jgi:hypothetical protein